MKNFLQSENFSPKISNGVDPAKKSQSDFDGAGKIVSFAKRRGFVFPSSEIYGGFSSCYDFGPLGVEMKNNIKRAWWKEMTGDHDNIVGLDSAILMSPKVWEASGHLTAGFADELVECKKCHHRFRKDLLESEEKTRALNFSKKLSARCPDCGGVLTKPRKFNLMMKTFVGPVEDDAATTYLRAETCQGIYVNFQNVLQSMRLKIPFGIAQIGKAFRNEVNPKDFLFRMREFEQMEMQWFCHPGEADKFFDYWLEQRLNWYYGLGIKKENLKTYQVPKKELAHYAKRAVDILYKFPFASPTGRQGWKEIEGVHNRGDWDLSNHSKYSGQDLRYYDQENSPNDSGKYYPYIIETSAGADRSFFAFLCEAYQEIKGGRTKTTEATKEVEVLLNLHKDLAPVKAAVFPLVKNKPELVKKAKEVYQTLKPHLVCQYDETGSIGRRYRRGDEVAIIVSITVDFQTLQDNTVTCRDRDTMAQIRVEISKLKEIIPKILKGENFLKFGEPVK